MRSLISVLFAILIVSCSGDSMTEPSPGGDTATVDAVGVTAWSPSPITIKSGESVTFRNNASVNHNVTFEVAAVGRPADIANFASGSRSATFTTAGTFDYHCGIHPAMQGRVVVQP